jgi:amino-acid N-acetyltransferase
MEDIKNKSNPTFSDNRPMITQQEQFVDWLRSVAPYIHAHRGKTFVVAIAGELIAAGRLNALVQDVALLTAMGVRIVLVHGFRPQVEAQLREKGVGARYSHGMRVTDEVALDAAQEAAGQLRFEIEATFSQGLPNTPMAGATVRVVSGNFIIARPVGVIDGLDFQHTGLVRKVDAPTIQRALEYGAVVLMSPFGYSPTGEAFNLSMEDVASSVGAAIKAEKLVLITEVDGVIDDAHNLIPELTVAQAESLLSRLPDPQQPTDTAFYLRHAVRAVRGGVTRAHIVPFAIDGSLLLELFTHDGVGTMIADEHLEHLRQATADDVGGILQLIEPLEEQGVLVKRSRTEIERDISYYTVLEHDGIIFGCAALYPYAEQKTGEMAALTVHPSAQGQGDGERILKHIEQRARALGLHSIFVLTTRTMHWFLKRGFVLVEREWLPPERRLRYDDQRRSRVLVKHLG